MIARHEVLDRAAAGATVLLNTPYPADEVWDSLPREAQEQVLAKQITLYAIDASKVAREAGLGKRANTVLQTCFFAISGVMPRDEAIKAIKAAIAKTYSRRGPEVVARNDAAVDAALAALHLTENPGRVTVTRGVPPVVPADAPEFVRAVTAQMMAGVVMTSRSACSPWMAPTQRERQRTRKRNISDEVAAWDPDLCIQCGNCSFVCPHSVIRSKFYDAGQLAGAPAGFPVMPLDARGLPDARYTLQVYAEDCTGCGLCVEACPASAPGDPSPEGDQPRGPRTPGGQARGVTSRSSRRSRSTTDHGSTSARFGAPSSCSRCSSSPVRAPAAARHPTSSSCPSCSATGWWSPTRPAARRSTAVTCRPPPGPPIRRDAARPGPTPCSRTTPSSGSASGSRPTSTSVWPVAGWRSSRTCSAPADRSWPRRS